MTENEFLLIELGIVVKGVGIENMAKFPSIEDMAKDVAQRAMQEITINDMPLTEFVEKVNNAIENNNCNLTTCRYNADGKCTNEEKREECVEVSRKVLCEDVNSSIAR